MSLHSTSSSLADKRAAMVSSSYVGRNAAQGRSIQVNGSLHFERLQVFIGHLCSAAGHVAVSDLQQAGKWSKTSARTTRVQSITPQTSKAFSSQGNMEWIATRKKSGKSPNSGAYVMLHNSSNGKEAIVRVTFDAKATCCLMDSRIVRRLGFESPRIDLPISGHNRILPRLTGSYIDLICDEGPGRIRDEYRFYIDDNCRFDILIGSSSSQSGVARA